jgi:hypothetical protein
MHILTIELAIMDLNHIYMLQNMFYIYLRYATAIAYNLKSIICSLSGKAE